MKPFNYQIYTILFATLCLVLICNSFTCKGITYKNMESELCQIKHVRII